MSETYQKSLKRRPAEEITSHYFYRPLAHYAVVVPLMHTNIKPTTVVCTHTLIGLLAAFLITRGIYVPAALLIQIKCVLDNADGQLARATGQTSEIGRYLDTETDFFVNLTLFAALGQQVGSVALGLLAFLGVTFIMTIEFLWERKYQQVRQPVVVAQAAPGLVDDGWFLKFLRALYQVIFVPQERLLGWLDERRYRSLLRQPDHEQLRQAYWSKLSVGFIVQCGESTQVALMGIGLWLGRPGLCLGWIALQWVALAWVQLRREVALGQAQRA
jgi:archaetidylinositol phosphate synthase